MSRFLRDDLETHDVPDERPIPPDPHVGPSLDEEELLSDLAELEERHRAGLLP